MNTLSMRPRAVELDDVQGLLRFGYKRHTEACFLLLKVEDADAARAFLSQVSVADAQFSDSPPVTVLQVALSSAGMTALGVPGQVVAGFAEEFVAGMATDEDRSRRLGDQGNSHPSHWEWGSGVGVPDVLLMLYAMPGHLDVWRAELEAQLDGGFSLLAVLDSTDSGGREPFGFRDGLSQPELDWERRRPVEDRDRLHYDNLSCLGEFLLGYPNEYGLYTDRPLLEPDRDPNGLLLRAEDWPERADLGRNGSYLVLRQLHQDIGGFWGWLLGRADGDRDLALRWAESMVGRSVDGKPLVHAEACGNDFTYDEDPQGQVCPIGAHIRRANPRNGDYPPGTRGLLTRLRRFLGFDAQARPLDLIASTRFHRLLRRGRSYGEPQSLDGMLAGEAPQTPAGLHFVCLAANIGRQFEFVQNAWINGTRFAGLPGEADPLLGDRQPGSDGTPSDCFSLPRPDGPAERLCALPRFVEVKGGAYFFLPGIRALRYLAGSSTR
ncbi:MAG: hypothetical protein KDH88_04205 [Chromatiales bacterium]|nr:hypothetical protein [Chromatiales bacterium]